MKHSRLIKKLTAIVLTVTFIVTLFSIVPIAETVTANTVWSDDFVKRLTYDYPLTNDYDIYVGYDRQLITPLSLDGTTTGETGVPLGGYGNEDVRLAVVGGKAGDEYYNVQQDLYAIVTAVMDGDGDIIIFIVNDIINGGRYDDIRKAVNLALGVPEDHIMVSGTHTHSSPTYSTSNKSAKSVSDKYCEYQDKQIVKACSNAIADLRPAQMSKLQLSIRTEDGKLLANVRHYEATEGQTDFYGTDIAKGDNCGAYYWDSEKQYWESSTRSNHITDADEQMQLLRFVRQDDNNVLMCNFQGHPVRTGNNASYVISSDIVGSFRDALARSGYTKKYRTSYYNGCGGNSNFSTQFDSTEGISVTIPANTTVNLGNSAFDGTDIDKTIYVQKALTFYSNGTLSETDATNAGITLNELRRLSSFYLGSEMANCVINAFKPANISAFKRVKGGKVKAKEYNFTADYHDPEDDINTKAATYINMLWTASNDQIKDMIMGTYAYTTKQIDAFSVINENVSAEEISAVKQSSKVKNITDEQATAIAKFVKRVQQTINGKRGQRAAYGTEGVKTFINGGTSSFMIKGTSESTRFTSKANFKDVIPTSAKTALATWLGHVSQSLDGINGVTIKINSAYHANSLANSRVSNKGTKYTAVLTTFSIGDASFINLPGEGFADNGKFIKNSTPTDMTFIMGYTNGTIGYLPSAYAHQYTSYETNTTRTNKGDAELIAGLQSDFAADLLFEGETFNLKIGDTKKFTRNNGRAIYSYTDEDDTFDYDKYSKKYKPDNVEKSDIEDYKYVGSAKWHSSNEKVATVAADGTITAVGNGIATISVVHTGSNARGTVQGSACCTVVVNDNNIHNQCDECGSTACKNTSHVKSNYTLWNSKTSLPTEAGHYYLGNDVTLSSPAEITENVYLCLNGKTVTASDIGGIMVKNGGKFTLSDCTDKGRIIMAYGDTEGVDKCVVEANNGGTFIMIGGTVDGSNTVNEYGTALGVDYGGTATIKGGTLLGGNAIKHGGTAYITGTLNLEGGTIGGGISEHGGSVSIGTNGSLNMTGGKITGGSATYGGALYLSSKNATINGGTITGGTANQGGSVFMYEMSRLVMNGGTVSNGLGLSNGGCFYIYKGTKADNSVLDIYGGLITSGSTAQSDSNYTGGNICTSSYTTVNIYGGSIEDGVAYGSGGNIYVNANSTVNMYGGTVTGGISYTRSNNTSSSASGYGGNIQLNGILNLSGGTIQNGIADFGAGGNISIINANAKINMTGGVIKNGSAAVKYTGNIVIRYNATDESLVMTGGKITDDSDFARVAFMNDAGKTVGKHYYGGGVACETGETGAANLISVSGTALIYGNHCEQKYNSYDKSNTYVDTNVYLLAGKNIKIGQLNGGMIGVTLQNNEERTFTVGGESSRALVTSDVAGYFVVKDGNGNLKLSKTKDTTPDPAVKRVGSPSDIPLNKSDAPLKDDFKHFNVAVNGTVDLSSQFSGVTKVEKISGGSHVSLTGYVAKGVSNGAETFAVTCSAGTLNVAVAVGHYHCLECGTFGCQIHTNYTFTSVDTISQATSGYYYLNKDCTVSAETTVASANKVNICLNGHTATGTTSIPRIFTVTGSKSALSVTDCVQDAEGYGTGVIKSQSVLNGNGGIVNIGTSATFNLYNGTMDGSEITWSTDDTKSNGACYYVAGTLNLKYGKTIGAEKAYNSGAIYLDSGKAVMDGGVIDCFNTVSEADASVMRLVRSSFTMNNGRIICGRQKTSQRGSILLITGSADTFTLNDGVIQDGEIYNEVSLDASGNVVGTPRNAGIFYMTNGTLNVNGGIIANGVAYGRGGNIFAIGSSDYSPNININGGVITGGKALYPAANYSNSSQVNGGNINVSSYVNINMTGGVIQNGVSDGSYGGNVSIWNPNTVFNMSGGIIKNGIGKGSYGGNVGIWYHAGNSKSTLIAFNMTGGLITDDEDFIVPAGYTAYGVSIMTTSDRPDGAYLKNTKFSGSARVVGNKSGNVWVDNTKDVDFKTGEFDEDGLISIYAHGSTTVATEVSETALAHIKLDEISSNYMLVYDSATGDLRTEIRDKYYASTFINKYLIDKDGKYFTEATKQNFEEIKATGAFAAWNLEQKSSQDDINLAYRDLCGVDDIGAMLLAAENMGKIEPYETFVADYLTDQSGNVITAATLDNYEQIIAAEQAYGELSSEQQQKADALVTVSVATLIANAKTIKANYETAVGFANTYLSNGQGGYYTAATLSNCEQIAGGATAWSGFNANIKGYVDGIIGTDVATVIENAVTIKTEYAAASEFASTYLSNGQGGYYTEVTYDNYEVIASAETAWGNLNANEKNYANGIIGVDDASALIAAAKQMANDKLAGESFVNEKLYKNDVLIAGEVTLTNYKDYDALLTETGAKTAVGELTEAQLYFANAYYKSCGGLTDADEFINIVKGYYDMLKVNIITSSDKSEYVFYSGLDKSAADYVKYGFEIMRDEYSGTIVSVREYDVCYEDSAEIIANSGNTPKSASEISSVTEHTYFCSFYVYKLDYERTVKIRSYILLEDGTKVYGEWIDYTFPTPSFEEKQIEVEETIDIDIQNPDYTESDFFN